MTVRQSRLALVVGVMLVLAIIVLVGGGRSTSPSSAPSGPCGKAVCHLEAPGVPNCPGGCGHEHRTALGSGGAWIIVALGLAAAVAFAGRIGLSDGVRHPLYRPPRFAG